MNLETLDPWAQRILGALFNGGYQGLLLTLAVALALRWTPRANAATRHAVWFVTLLLVALLPVLHGVRDVGFERLMPRTGAESQARPLPMEILEPSTIGPAVPSLEPSHTPFLISDREPLEPLLESEFGPPAEENPSFEVPELVGGLSEPAKSTTSAVLAGAVPWRFSLPVGWPLVLVTIWLGIAGVRLLALAWQLGRLRSLKRCATPAPAEWQDLFERAAVEMELKRPTRLALAADVSTPMVIGLGRPTVVLPAAGFEQVSRDQLLQVLRHELGHVVRGDDWMNLIQQVIRAVLFFHPAVGWVSRRLTLEREVACDDHVLAASGSPKAYALLLTEFAGRMPGRDFAAAPAAWNHQTQLKERIHMILDSKRNASPRLVGVRLAILTAASLALTGLALQAAPRISLSTDPTSGAEVAVVTDVSVEDVAVADPTVTTATPFTVSTDPNLVVAVEDVTTISGGSGLIVSSTTTLPSSIQVVSGPRSKKSQATSVEAAPPPEALAVPPTPPLPAEVVPPPHAPTPPQDASLEQRLDRLERLVNQLLSRTSGTKELSNRYVTLSEQQVAKISAEAQKAAHESLKHEEVARIQVHAQQEIERAKRDVERARAQREQIKIKVANPEIGQELERVQAQRKSIESRRRALEAQMDALEQEMESLEEAREQLREKVRVEAPRRSKERDNQNSNDSSNNAENPTKTLKY